MTPHATAPASCCQAALAGQIDRLVCQEVNRGKGAALRAGFAVARGDFLVVQDADLEYDPAELPGLLAPLTAGRADVVFGSRFTGTGPHRVLYFWHYVANAGLTLLCNAFSNVNLTDMETCYKMFRRELLPSLDLREDRFGFEPEFTIKAARLGCRMYEIGHFVPRADLSGRQEDRLARRVPRGVRHRQVRPDGAAPTASPAVVRPDVCARAGGGEIRLTP